MTADASAPEIIGPAGYGMIGSLRAHSGQRAALIEALVKGSTGLPDCPSYVIAEDASDPDVIWLSEVWTNKAAHLASYELPQVKAAIARIAPLLAGAGDVTEARVIAIQRGAA